MPQVTVEALVEQAKLGNLVSFPTDTVPALAVRPDCADRIFATKQRDLSKPLILMGATLTDLWDYVTGTDGERQIWQQVTDRYLPGALTLVLPASDRVPQTMNPKDPTTIGIRVPDQAMAQAILAQTGPLATTSANRSGQPPLETMGAIAAEFPEVFALQLSDLEDHPASGTPSTVAQWTGETWKILRQGAVELRV